MQISRVSILAGLVAVASARIHTLKLKRDDRNLFSIETFGFEKGGTLLLDVRAFHLSGKVSDPPLVGLTLRKVSHLRHAIAHKPKV